VQLVGHVACEPLHTSPPPHAGLPGWPSASVTHVPVAQSPQLPHAVPQHTPETQKPLLHASFAPAGHDWPSVPCAAHVPALHQPPVPQLASTVHDEEHTPLAHTPGEQLVPVPATHVPLPLQVLGVAELPTHVAPHDVPAT
jgi:hypothetical protein